MNVRCMLHNGGVTPRYATMGSAGADITSNKECEWTPIYSEPFEINNTEVKMIVGWKCIVSTGVYVELPKGYELQVRPRSGSAFKHNVSIINAPGTIDEDYRGEIGIALMVNGALAPEMFVQDVETDDMPNPKKYLPKGMKVAQCVLVSVDKAKYIQAEQLGKTARGDSGFGSTGLISDTPVNTTAKVSVEFNVGDIHLLDITIGTMARLVKSLEDYNKDFKGVEDVYATNVPDDKKMFVTYDVYEFDYNKQELFDKIKGAVDLLGGKEQLEEAYNSLPEKKSTY